MYPASDVRVSELLLNEGHGELGAREKLIPLAYGRLRLIAGHFPVQEYPYHWLQSVALVHRTYWRLPHKKPRPKQNRAQFFGVVSQFTRRPLVDYGRTGLAAKREWARAQARLQSEKTRKEVVT